MVRVALNFIAVHILVVAFGSFVLLTVSLEHESGRSFSLNACETLYLIGISCVFLVT